MPITTPCVSFEHLSSSAIQLFFDEFHSQSGVLDILSVVRSYFDSSRQIIFSLALLCGLFWFFLHSPIWGSCEEIFLVGLGRLGLEFSLTRELCKKLIKQNYTISFKILCLISLLIPWVTPTPSSY